MCFTEYRESCSFCARVGHCWTSCGMAAVGCILLKLGCIAYLTTYILGLLVIVSGDVKLKNMHLSSMCTASRSERVCPKYLASYQTFCKHRYDCISNSTIQCCCDSPCDTSSNYCSATFPRRTKSYCEQLDRQSVIVAVVLFLWPFAICIFAIIVVALEPVLRNCIVCISSMIRFNSDPVAVPVAVPVTVELVIARDTQANFVG